MRYGTGSVILFNCAESPVENVSIGDYFVRLQATFRTSELTSNVPFAVRSAFRNDWLGGLVDNNKKKDVVENYPTTSPLNKLNIF